MQKQNALKKTADQNQQPAPQGKAFIILGAALILLAIGCNVWVWQELVKNSLLDTDANRVFIWVFNIGMMALGLYVIKAKNRTIRHLIPLLLSIAFALVLFVSVDMYLGYRQLIQRNEDDKNSIRIENVHVPDDKLGWKPKPGNTGLHQTEKFDVHYILDENGYKAVNNTGTPDITIYFFGDSYTFGHGVKNDDTFANIIADNYLKDAVHVYNTGVMGYGITQMYQRFLNMQDKIEPGDIIIFTPLPEDINRNAKEFVVPAQYIFRDSLTNVEHYPYFDNGELSYITLDTLFNRFKALLFYAPFTGKNFQFIHQTLTRADTTADSVEMLNTIKSITEARGGQFILFFLPHPSELRQGRYDEDLSAFEYHDVMAFYPTDNEQVENITLPGHWNRTGHQITASAIVDTLVEKHLIDAQYLNYTYASPNQVLADQLKLLRVGQQLTSDALRLDVVWQGRPQTDRDYTVFVQLLNKDGGRVTGVDVLPQPGFSTLRPHQKVATQYAVPLPEQPGEYSLLIGLYYFDENGDIVNAGATTLDKPVIIEQKKAPAND